MKKSATGLTMNGFSKLMLALIGICFCASLLLTIGMRMGYTLVYTGAYFYLPLAAIGFLALWGVYAVVRRCQRFALKAGVGILLGTGAAVVLLLAFFYISVYLTYSGSRFATLESADGEHRAAVMQGYYYDEERIARRYGEGYAGETKEEDLMYDYRAYPLVAGAFLDTSREPDHIYIALDSEDAQLMSEWQEDGSLRLYIDQPGEDDRGELVVLFP